MLTRNRLIITGLATALLVCIVIVRARTLSRATAARGIDEVIELWPDVMPGPRGSVLGEHDTTRTSDELVAGRRVMRLTNVTRPELHLMMPDNAVRTDTAVVVCPGGGFSVLAWDLEGIEVGDWLNQQGITAAVLKYRVPTRREHAPWEAPLQDTQRAISWVRNNSTHLNIDPDKIGVLGFSAGAAGAIRSGLMTRQYDRADEIDDQTCRPSFIIAVYPGGIMDAAGERLANELVVGTDTPPLFATCATDDAGPNHNCKVLTDSWKLAGIASEMQLYDSGGHGYGIRLIADVPATQWTDRCERWMSSNGWLKPVVAAEQVAAAIED